MNNDLRKCPGEFLALSRTKFRSFLNDHYGCGGGTDIQPDVEFDIVGGDVATGVHRVKFFDAPRGLLVTIHYGSHVVYVARAIAATTSSAESRIGQ